MARVGEAQHGQTPRAAELLRSYLDHLAHERRLSAHTLSNYRRDLETLIARAGETPLAKLQVHDVRRLVSQLHAKGLGPRSLARMLSAWRGFYRYLARDHGYTDNPCLGIRAPKAAKRLPHALSPDEANRLLDANADTALAVRDKAMFELFYSSGLRLSELTGLAPADVNRGEGTVRVTGKGSKTRIVPVGTHALRALDAWLETRAQIPRHDRAALFVNRLGQRLTPRSVQQRLKTWALKRGVSTRVHPHVLRHSFASHVLQSSGDLRAVQEMLGHASISTTQVYTHLDFQHLAKVYDAAHPRARRQSAPDARSRNRHARRGKTRPEEK
ncbi:MAG TPA: tyrosine recombinase XerC [Burkholderiales bacterium]|nr:tyrosine recombinase XerC [Burkholderiales bacterium]